MENLHLTGPQRKFSFLDLKMCKRHWEIKACKLQHSSIILIAIILITCISSSISSQHSEGTQSLDGSEGLMPLASEKLEKESLAINSAEKNIENLSLSIDEAEPDEGLLKNEDTSVKGETTNIKKDDFAMDPIFNEIIEPSLRINTGTNGNRSYDLLEFGKGNASATYPKSKEPYLYNAFDFEDWERGKRGALHLAGIIYCATKCNPLSFKGYGCFCGFMGAGEPVDGIDMCCKMHDWCYTTTSCHGLEWDLPYFVPFKWKCNGGAPYCIPGKTKKTNRSSCSHQLCECDREFALCLRKHMPCPKGKASCKNKKRLWQNLLMGLTSGHGMHHPHKSGATYFPKKPSKHHHHHHGASKPRTLNNHFNPFKIFG